MGGEGVGREGSWRSEGGWAKTRTMENPTEEELPVLSGLQRPPSPQSIDQGSPCRAYRHAVVDIVATSKVFPHNHFFPSVSSVFDESLVSSLSSPSSSFSFLLLQLLLLLRLPSSS